MLRRLEAMQSQLAEAEAEAEGTPAPRHTRHISQSSDSNQVQSLE